jgi:SAM-dependent methyltransferase
MEYNQTQYWIERHKHWCQDPRSVGNLAATLEENIKGEALWQQVAGAVAEILPVGSVLDIGCGYGRVAREFIMKGHRYTGLDVSPEAIARARIEHSTGKFICADLSQWKPLRRYDAILAFYVYINFVDDPTWRSIVEKTLMWLAPKGVLVMADAIVDTRQQLGQHVVTRPLEEYEEIFAGWGFRFDTLAHAELVDRLPGINSTAHVRFVRR